VAAIFLNSSYALSEGSSEMLDVHISSTSNDIDKYVRLVEQFREEQKLVDELRVQLVSKTSDLIHYLPGVKNTKIVNNVCKSQIEIYKNVVSLSNNCQSSGWEEVCQDFYVIRQICVAKGLGE
jgi:hypothetical protein